jgi:hypothetical protein
MKAKFKKMWKVLNSFEVFVLYIATFTLASYAVVMGVQSAAADKGLAFTLIVAVVVYKCIQQKVFHYKVEGWNQHYEQSMENSMNQLAQILEHTYPLPVEIDNDYRILSVDMWYRKNFGVSSWEITGEYKDEFFKVYIIRQRDENTIDIINELKETKNPDEILDMDEREKE